MDAARRTLDPRELGGCRVRRARTRRHATRLGELPRRRRPRGCRRTPRRRRSTSAGSDSTELSAPRALNEPVCWSELELEHDPGVDALVAQVDLEDGCTPDGGTDPGSPPPRCRRASGRPRRLDSSVRLSTKAATAPAAAPTRALPRSNRPETTGWASETGIRAFDRGQVRQHHGGLGRDGSASERVVGHVRRHRPGCAVDDQPRAVVDPDHQRDRDRERRERAAADRTDHVHHEELEQLEGDPRRTPHPRHERSHREVRVRRAAGTSPRRAGCSPARPSSTPSAHSSGAPIAVLVKPDGPEDRCRQDR